MKTNEFKAWFDGFTEAMGGLPTEAQWEKIKKRVSEIDGTPVSYPVFVDRYRPRSTPYWWNVPFESYSVYSSNSSRALKSVECSASAAKADGVYDSTVALYMAGKADFEETFAA